MCSVAASPVDVLSVLGKRIVATRVPMHVDGISRRATRSLVKSGSSHGLAYFSLIDCAVVQSRYIVARVVHMPNGLAGALVWLGIAMAVGTIVVDLQQRMLRQE